MAELGNTGVVVRYFRSEVTVTGNGKLFVRGVTDGSPPGIEATVDRIDVFRLIAGKPSFTSTVQQGVTDPRVSTIAVYIDDHLAYCGKGPHGPDSGRSGLVFSSYEDTDAINVGDFTVGPTRYDGVWTLCRDQFPP